MSVALSQPRAGSTVASAPTGFRSAIRRRGLPLAVKDLIFGPPKPPTLRPRGHIAWVEQLQDPLVVGASVALTVGAILVMAQGLITQFSDALAAGRVPNFAICLSLAALGFVGSLFDVALIIAGSRFRMHALRKEVGWAILHATMLCTLITIEGLTWSYLLFHQEPGAVSGPVAAFIQQIPAILFLVRPYLGPLCIVYLTAAVLPLTLQRGDVDREVASSSGSASVAIVRQLVQWIQMTGISSPQQAVELLGLTLALFRISAGHQTETQDTELVDAFRDLGVRITSVITADSAGDLPTADFNAQLVELRALVERYRGEARAANITTIVDDAEDGEDGLGASAARSPVPITTHQSGAPAPAMHMELVARAPSAKAKPRVDSPEYADYVEKVARRLAAKGPLTLQGLEATIGDSHEAIVRAIAELRQRDAESQPAGRRPRKPVDGLFALVERAS